MPTSSLLACRPLALASLVLLALPTAAQIGRPAVPHPEWEPLAPLAGAGPLVFDLARNALEPHVVHAASTAGVLRSTDGGATWGLETPWPDRRGTYFQFDVSPVAPQNITLARNKLGLFSTKDGGATWFEPVTPPEGIFFKCVAYDPVLPDVVFAGASGVSRSDDGGLNYTKVLDAGFCSELLIDRNNRLRVYAIFPSAGVYASTDGGTTWTLRPFAAGQSAYLSAALDPSDGRRLLIGGDGVHLSEDEGHTWTSLGDATNYVDAVAFDPLDRDRFYASQRYQGLLLTEDGGASWTLSADPGLEKLGEHPRAILPSVSEPNELLLGGAGGFFRSIDGGQTFARSNAGLEEHAYVPAVAVDSGDPSHLVAKTGGSAFVSLDGGLSWTESSAGPAFSSLDVVADPATPGRFWAAGRAGKLWRSDDGGFSFYIAHSDPAVGFWHIKPHPTLPDVLFGAGAGLRRSDDGGFTFTQLGVPQNWVWDVEVSTVDPNVMYASATYDVYWSHDGGATWTAAATPPPPIVRDVEADPVDPFRAWAAVPGQGLYRTDDGGATWIVMAPELTTAQVTHHPTSHPGLLVIGDLLNWDVRSSNSGGETTRPLGRGVESAIQSFASTATELLAASAGHGVYVLR